MGPVRLDPSCSLKPGYPSHCKVTMPCGDLKVSVCTPVIYASADFDRIQTDPPATAIIELGSRFCAQQLQSSTTSCLLRQCCSVNKLCISDLLHCGNDPRVHWCGVCSEGFLPTMQVQPSQLPMIVGSGRVAIRRALFSCAGRSPSIN